MPIDDLGDYIKHPLLAPYYNAERIRTFRDQQRQAEQDRAFRDRELAFREQRLQQEGDLGRLRAEADLAKGGYQRESLRPGSGVAADFRGRQLIELPGLGSYSVERPEVAERRETERGRAKRQLETDERVREFEAEEKVRQGYKIPAEPKESPEEKRERDRTSRLKLEEGIQKIRSRYEQKTPKAERIPQHQAEAQARLRALNRVGPQIQGRNNPEWDEVLEGFKSPDDDYNWANAVSRMRQAIRDGAIRPIARELRPEDTREYQQAYAEELSRVYSSGSQEYTNGSQGYVAAKSDPFTSRSRPNADAVEQRYLEALPDLTSEQAAQFEAAFQKRFGRPVRRPITGQ